MFTGSTQIVSFLFGLTFSVLVARILGPDGQGQFALWILVPTLLARFGHFGFDASFSYFALDERFPQRVIFSTWFYLVSLSVVLTSFLLTLNHLELLTFTVIPLPSYILNSLGILAVLFVSRTLLMSFLVGQNKIGLHSALSVLEAAVPLLIILGVMAFLIVSVEIVYSAIFASMFLINLILIHQCYASVEFPNLKFVNIAFKYGVKSWTNNIVNQLIYRADLLLIAYFLGLKEVGLYSIALLLVEKSWFFTAAISNALFPILRAEGARNGTLLTSRIVRFSVFFSFVFSLMLILSAHKLLPLIFGEAFIQSVSPLLWLLPGTIALTVPKILVTQFAALNKMELAVFSSSPALIVNILLNLILIPYLGLQGAAIGTSISYVIYCCLSIGFFKKLTDVPTKDLLIMNRGDWVDLVSFLKMVIRKRVI